MGEQPSMIASDDRSQRLPRLARRRPRSFTEWSALRRWGKLPPWEVNVPGNVLREARRRASLTQQSLADQLGITQQAVSQAEQWDSNPTVGFMSRWIAVCGHRLELRIEQTESS